MMILNINRARQFAQVCLQVGLVYQINIFFTILSHIFLTLLAIFLIIGNIVFEAEIVFLKIEVAPKRFIPPSFYKFYWLQQRNDSQCPILIFIV